MITETTSGRAFEVTEDLDIVWTYYNPARAGGDNELIAALFEVVRIERDYPQFEFQRSSTATAIADR